MCGIVGYAGLQESAPILLDGLKKLEYRGYDSAGIAILNDKKISVSKVTGRIANLCEKTNDGRDYTGKVGIGHTRWATHGAPTDTNAHPHMSNDGKFAVVHKITYLFSTAYFKTSFNAFAAFVQFAPPSTSSTL